MDNNTLRQNIFTALGPFLLARRIWSDQSKTRPPKPYASLTLSDEETIGNPTRHATNLDGEQTTSAQKQELLTIEYIGTGAYGSLKDFKRQLKTTQLTYQLIQTGIAIRSIGNVLNITELLNEINFEERAQLEIVLAYKSVTVDNTGVIDNVVSQGLLGAHEVNQEFEALVYVLGDSEEFLLGEDGEFLLGDV